MKIGLISKAYPPGAPYGGPKSAKLLVEGLRERGHDVQVLSFIPGTDHDPEYIERRPWTSERTDINLARSISEVRTFSNDKDIVHAYNRKVDPLLGLVDKPTISTLNHFKYEYPREIPGLNSNPALPVYRKYFNNLCRSLMKRIDCFAAISPYMKDYYSQDFGEHNVEVIPNMYDPEFSKNIEENTRENEILYIGAVKERKGLKGLISQLPELEDKYVLRIIGDGDEKESLEELVQSKGLEDRVVFEGFVDNEDLPRYYARAAWFVHPAKWPEPFGRTLLEAFQMGTPVIATNKGGPKDILPENQLIDSLDKLPEKLNGLDKSKVVAEQEKILSEYSPKRVISEYEQLYREIISAESA